MAMRVDQPVGHGLRDEVRRRWGDSVKENIRRLHVNDRARLLKHNLATLLFFALGLASLVAWQYGLWPLTIVCWLAAGHCGHAKVIAFHEAAHGTLNANRLRNEVQGLIIGSAAFIPLSVYRLCHWQHHAYIATQRDPELWPFTSPRTPLAARRLAALLEIVFGAVYTPLLMLRGFLIAEHVPRDQQRRILLEYLLCIAVWAVLLGVVARTGAWSAFAVAMLAPMFVAGAFQTLNKYTEHMGLLGDTVLSSTRTVVDKSSFGTLLSRTILNVDYHGTHHRYAKVPYYNLPEATPYVYDEDARNAPLFSSYLAALVDMLPTLRDPRIGREWIVAAADVDLRLDAPRQPLGPHTARRAGREAEHDAVTEEAENQARRE